MSKITLSKLPHTWIFDLDGTILKHNSFKTDDEILPGVKNFFDQIDLNDKIVFITAREEAVRKQTENTLRKNNIRWDKILFNFPVGERIVLNDIKPLGLKTAIAINLERDKGLVDYEIFIDEEI